jgi:hypothetical protein
MSTHLANAIAHIFPPAKLVTASGMTERGGPMKLIFAVLFLTGFVMAQTSNNRVESITAPAVNGVLNAGSCAQTPAPSWCSGSEIGGWIRAAIEALPSHCGSIYIPAGAYSQNTTALIPRCVKLSGAGAYSTTITYSASTGWAFVVADRSGDGFYPEGSIEDLTLLGTGARATGGIYFGGSTGREGTPPTSLDPADNWGDHTNLNRVRVGGNQAGFGVGVQFGNDVWSNTLHESILDGNRVNYYYPGGLTNSGERLSIVSCSLQNAIGIDVKIETDPAVDVQIVNSSLDYNGSWAIQNGTSVGNQQVSLINSHVEQPTTWIQNFGSMTVVGSIFVNGTKSGELGWLIDNEYDAYTHIGGWIHNAGKGQIFNPSGVGGTVFGVTATSAVNKYSYYMDNHGNVFTKGNLEISGVTPTGTGSELGLGTTYGFGNGRSGASMTTTTRGSGTGPENPQTVVKYLEIDVGGTKYWIPLVQ